MRQISFILVTLALAMGGLSTAESAAAPAAIKVPQPEREFRGAWIATVANIDWPSKPGLTVAQQKQELISLLDHAADLKLNAVLFQVRPVCDAFYASGLEPWSEYITGTQGRPPEPSYDPLALAVAESHKRGLQLHAWLNPFRAGHPEAKSATAKNHISRTHPELVRHYGRQIWLDPGEPAARDHVVAVVLDIVKRYDVDGIVFDDYFYPYPEKDRGGRELDFPDAASWKKQGVSTGLSRDDWRRDNVNQFIHKLGRSIKAAKPWVQFGISPFGIWRPQNPPTIRGLDAFGELYADARLWLASGWVDYLAPQLYWSIAAREQSFPVLLQWWRSQNTKGRHLYAALNDAEAGRKFSSDEIARQIQITRAQTGVGGAIHYHLRNTRENTALRSSLREQYARPALAPVMPWIDSAPSETPKLTVIAGKKSAKLSWQNAGAEPARLWLLQVLNDGSWRTEIIPQDQTAMFIDNSPPEAVSLRAVDRAGNLSSPALWTPAKTPPASLR